MGIKGLPNLIKNTVGESAISEYPFSHFKGRTIAIDASLMIYQTVIALRSKGKDLINEKGELTSHLSGVFYKTLNFLSMGITPIFVFDGKPPDIKADTLDKRKNAKIKASENMKATSLEDDKEEFVKNFKRAFFAKESDFKELQTMLDLMGVPYIIAPGEAEVVCAWLAATTDENGDRYAHGACTNDSDVLPLGAPFMYKDMLTFMNNSKDKFIKVINLKRTLKGMKLDHKEFIELCVLLGCDYCGNIPGIGPKKAYDLIHQYRSLEKIFDHLSTNNSPVSEEQKKCMITAREYFLSAMDEIDNNNNFTITDDNLKLRSFQYHNLIDFMCSKHNFDLFKIEKGVGSLRKSYNKMNVTRPNDKIVYKPIRQLSKEYVISENEEI